ncbi:VMAP-C domain-containing protein [Streptomyces viridiviolaceus]
MEGRSAARVRNELLAEMAGVLAATDTVRRQAGAEMLVQDVSAELRLSLDPRQDQPLGLWSRHLVKRCAEADEGLQTLARCLNYAEQGSVNVLALWRLVDEWEATAFFKDMDLRPLRPVLREIRSTSLLTTLARRASHSRTQELEAWCDTGWEVFLHLAGNNMAVDELPPSMAFLSLAAEHLVKEGRTEEAEDLRRWNRKQARLRGLTEEMAGWRQEDFPPPGEPSLLPAYLLIQFEPDGVDPDNFWMAHWRQSDADGWHPLPGETVKLHRDELPAAVDRLVEQAEERWSDLRQPVVIEFILPWTLLAEPVEWWHKEADAAVPTPLVMDYTVVVRSFERLRRTAWHRPWNNRWRQLKDRPAESRSFWSSPGRSAFHLERELKDDQQIVCLVLSAPPGSDSPLAQQEFVAALRAGIPAILWDRGDSGTAFREAAGDILQERGLAGVLERTRRWRDQALALGPEGWHRHVGRHLALLLDDPERMPGPSTAGGGSDSAG